VWVEERSVRMDVVALLVFLAVWILLQTVILPRLGVDT
jgi:hypothetical protein